MAAVLSHLVHKVCLALHDSGSSRSRGQIDADLSPSIDLKSFTMAMPSPAVE